MTDDIQLPLGAVEAFARRDAKDLARLLQLRPWQVNPVDAVGPCPYPSSAGGQSWPMAVRVRHALEVAVRAPKRRN